MGESGHSPLPPRFPGTAGNAKLAPKPGTAGGSCKCWCLANFVPDFEMVILGDLQNQESQNEDIILLMEEIRGSPTKGFDHHCITYASPWIRILLGSPDVPTIPGGSTGSGKGAGLKTATLGDRIPVWVRKKPAIWKLCLKRIHSKWWFTISGMILTSSWMCFVFWWVAYNSSLGIVIITTMISNTTHKPHESTEKERSNHHGFSSIQCHVLANGHPCKLSKVVLPGVPLTGGGLASGFGRFEVYRQMLGAWILGGVPLRMPSNLSSLIAGRFSKICGQIERLIHTPLIQKDLDWLWNILAALLYARYYQSSLQVMGWRCAQDLTTF